MRYLLLLAPLLACEAQQPLLTLDLLLLAKVKATVMENLTHLPNYTCSETIERYNRVAPTRKLKLLDTVKLEVALADGHEFYGWPGANRISQSELSTMVGGTIGNGDFGLLAKSIFGTSAALFTYVGDTKLKDQPAVQFQYKVPILGSGYHLKVGQNEAIVGYHGSFWIQPDSLDLLRLDLTADDIPDYLGLASTTKTLRYERMRIGDSDFLLPSGSELGMTEFSGAESRNVANFHTCRQYMGESKLSFEDPPAERVEQTTEAPAPLELPDKFDAELSLLTPINADSTAVGDEIQVRLERNVSKDHKTIVPKGAILTARILKLHHLGRGFHLALSFHSLDCKDGHADLTGRENDLVMMARPRDTARFYSNSFIPANHGRLVIEGDSLKLPRGFLLRLHSRLVKSDKR